MASRHRAVSVVQPTVVYGKRTRTRRLMQAPSESLSGIRPARNSVNVTTVRPFERITSFTSRSHLVGTSRASEVSLHRRRCDVDGRSRDVIPGDMPSRAITFLLDLTMLCTGVLSKTSRLALKAFDNADLHCGSALSNSYRTTHSFHASEYTRSSGCDSSEKSFF